MHKSRRGRHQINLFNVLKGDLDKRGLLLKDIDDLFNLRILAKDRLLWKEYYDKVWHWSELNVALLFKFYFNSII